MAQGLFDIGVEKKENKVLLRMDSDLGFGQAGIKMEIRSFLENIKKVKRMGAGQGFTLMVRRSMKGSMKSATKQENGATMMKMEKRI